jgi:hypothetical protein
MKQATQTLIVLITVLPIWCYAQQDFQKGFIITAANEKKEGLIRQSLPSGTITFLSEPGNRKTFTPADIQGFSSNGINYISYLNDFYKEIFSGKTNLYQKVTDNGNRLLYNGPDVVGFWTTAAGAKGDFYIRQNTETELTLITKKNFQKMFVMLFENVTVKTSSH